jgi:hypothetical protein
VTTDAPTIEEPIADTPTEETITVADVDTAVETPDDAQPEESKADDEEKPLRDDKGKFKGVQARIDELTRARREAERSAEYWKGLATQTAQPSAEIAAKPTADQFDDYADYVEALTDWKVEQKTRDVSVKAVQNAETMHRQSNWADRQEAVKSKLADYDTVVGSSDVPVSEHVRDALLDSEHGPELAYHLARNPSFAADLNNMSATRAALELGRLESQLDNAPAPKPVSKAPAPITPLTTGATGRVNLATASMEDYIAERKRMGANL